MDDVGKIFDSEPGFVVVPNPNLKAEYAYNGDIGFSKIFAEKFRLDFTAFYTVLTDALVRRNYSLNGADSIMYAGEMSPGSSHSKCRTSYCLWDSWRYRVETSLWF